MSTAETLDPTTPEVPAVQPSSRLDKALKRALDFSKVATLLTGFGLASLYLVGIAVYMMSTVVLGVPPFEFSLDHCLEQGLLNLLTLLSFLPILVLLGLKHLWSTRGLVTLVIGVLLLLASVALSRRRSIRSGSIVVPFLIMSVSLVLFIGYRDNIGLLGSSGLLTDPAVNYLIESGEEPDFSELGLQPWSTYTSWLIEKDDADLLAILGAIIVWHSAALFLVFATLKSLLVWRSLVPSAGKFQRILRIAISGGRVAGWTYVALVAFWLPAAMAAFSARALPKVDVSIEGLEDLTGREYLIQIAEYEDRYTFYVPTQLSVLEVPKTRVRYILNKGQVSAFSERSTFRKGPWLGVTVERIEGSSAADPHGVEIASVALGTTAQRLGLIKGDRVISLNGARLASPADLLRAEASSDLVHPVFLEVSRGEQSVRVEALLGSRP